MRHFFINTNIWSGRERRPPQVTQCFALSIDKEKNLAYFYDELGNDYTVPASEIYDEETVEKVLPEYNERYKAQLVEDERKYKEAIERDRRIGRATID